MHRRGDRTNGSQLNCWCPTRLLQLSTAWHHYLEHQQNPTCHQHTGSSGHRHWKTQSHNTGLGETTLAPSPAAHHFQSRSHNLQNTSFKKTGLSLGVAVLPSCAKNTPIEFFKSFTRWCSQDCFCRSRLSFCSAANLEQSSELPDRLFSVIGQFQKTT